MPKFIIVDLANVLVDGLSAGAITDVFANHGRTPGDQGELLSALHAWRQAILDNHAGDLKTLGDQYAAAAAAQVASHEATLAGLRAQHQEQLDALSAGREAERADHRKAAEAWEARRDADRRNLVAAHAKTVAGLRAKLEKAEGDVKEYRAHLHTLGDLPAVRKLARETRRKQIRHELDRLENEDLAEANPAESQPS